jgi:phenylacetate-CoA ligase
MPRLNYQIVKLIAKVTPPDLLEKVARLKAFLLIRAAIKKVSAYKKFLEERGFDIRKIKTFYDFKKLPLTDKKNYFIKYGIEETLFKKTITQGYSWEHSSNYDPDVGLVFWPRFLDEESKCLINLEFLLRYIYKCDKKRTLIVVGFVLGMWSAGERISRFAKQLAKNKNLKIAVATPGASRKIIVDFLKAVGRDYEQIILVGNPYFLRRVIEYGEKQKFNWRDFDIYLLTAGEGFPEDWREFVVKKIVPKKEKTDLLITKRLISILGLTETSGSFGTETPLANLIRRLFSRDAKLRKLFFGDTDSLPMVFQYNPLESFL